MQQAHLCRAPEGLGYVAASASLQSGTMLKLKRFSDLVPSPPATGNVPSFKRSSNSKLNPLKHHSVRCESMTSDDFRHQSVLTATTQLFDNSKSLYEHTPELSSTLRSCLKSKLQNRSLASQL